MTFRLLAQDAFCNARAGELTTAHGRVRTPAFMPVGTTGAVKAVHLKDLEGEIKPDIILTNTYHLYLRPGIEVLQQSGGIHQFSGWTKPILTDSGGYQIYSLAQKRKISEQGVTFQSHINGSKHLFTPENIIDIQRSIGADIIMALDECTAYPCTYDYAKQSMELTHRWLTRCYERFCNTNPYYDYEQALFPIVQGSIYSDLRKESAETIAAYDLPGNAIGGLSVGEPEELLYEMTALSCSILPTDKPRYLMGVGTPVNLLECIALGVDMFDCVIPTRNGRNGMLFTRNGIINIRNKKWEKDFSPIDEQSPAFVGRTYSKAFLRHLMQCHEILGAQIATLQNLSFYIWLMNEARNQIIQGTFYTWKTQISKIISQRL